MTFTQPLCPNGKNISLSCKESKSPNRKLRTTNLRDLKPFQQTDLVVPASGNFPCIDPIPLQMTVSPKHPIASVPMILLTEGFGSLPFIYAVPSIKFKTYEQQPFSQQRLVAYNSPRIMSNQHQ
jgi:hypothetical protein